ncbi:MAG: hypothetical protein HWN79_11210 [Candidatus Lokiarchaeota archaeon]|nr:hypothetical protein [Candidatus Lokiarchaeota archaeon]
MEGKEELAQEALRYLSIAQNFEEGKDFEKAIENYHIAADYLKSSGYLINKIGDIYSRIEDLKEFAKQEKIYNQASVKSQIEQMQDEAFSLLDGAQKLESDGFLEDAIDQYMSAIKLLVQAGWSETQLGDLKTKLSQIAGKIEQGNLVKKQRSSETQQPMTASREVKPQVLSAFGEKNSAAKEEELKKYKEMKEQEERIQNEAFTFIDNAKFFENDRKFDKAIENYQNAVNLLESIGWQDQTQNIILIINKLKKEKSEYEKFKAQKLAKPTIIEERSKEEVIDIEEIRRDEENKQFAAFNLVDIGKKLEREKKYDQAITNFEKAIKLFKSIEWDSYIQPVKGFIKNVKEKQENEEKTEELTVKRESELKNLQDTIYLKEREEIIQTARELDQKRLEHEQKRREEARREEQFFTVLDEADKLLKENRAFSEATKKYTEALDLLTKLGAGWESHATTIKNTISSIKKIQETQIEKELEEQKKLEQRKKLDLDFQQQTSIQLAKEREKIKQRESALQVRRDEIEYREKQKEAAFKALDAAEDYIKQSELDKAITAYQTAGNIFASIQWNEELHLIENSIRDLEIRKRDQAIAEQKEMQKSIEKYKTDQQFQEHMSKQLQQERERLRKKEIRLRDQKAELEYREKRKEYAFRILDEAQPFLEKGDYEKTIEIYQEVTNIFAGIQWYDEMERIGNAIIEIENKKRNAEIKKQREIEKQINREREDREFQEKVISEMKIKRDQLKQREAVKKKREDEISFRETQKQEAFRTLDEAQNYLSLGKFDLAIDKYREVNGIFAQIQWLEEIPLINQTINQIENKRKEEEFRKQREFEQIIKEEAENQKFLDNIKIQRKREQLKILKIRESEEQKREFSAQHLTLQNNAFKMIEDADEYLKRENFEEALGAYQNALNVLENIGWTGNYITLLKDSIQSVQFKKREKEQSVLLEKEKLRRQWEEEREFEQEVAHNLQKEKERMIAKKIELLKKEEVLQMTENQKEEAFRIMENAEELLKQGNYEQAIDNYYQAELILIQINFPTDLVKDAISKIQEEKRKADLAKQQELEAKLRKEEDERQFLQAITNKMKFEDDQMRAKQVKIKKQEELKAYLEKRKEVAFELIDEADNLVKRGNYDKALEYYRSVELVLSEINYPTNSIKEQIVKVKERKRSEELQKQKELETKLQKDREEFGFQRKIAGDLIKEKKRLKLKQIAIEKRTLTLENINRKKDDAFRILDDAERHIKNSEFELALLSYRKAMLILNEIQFPTDSINEMITKVSNLKSKKGQEAQHVLKRELVRLKEEKSLETIIEERRKQEREKKIAQQIALQQREKTVQDQLTYREAAYSFLEDGGKFLKGRSPDYDKAISLYIQARNLLAEKIGWEPEINNLNILINDLVREKDKYREKKKLEAETRIKRQQEYELFRQQIQKQQLENELNKREQQKKLRKLYEDQKYAAITKEEGLSLIDEGKELAMKYNFDDAYKKFNRAIQKFNEIGWSEQTKYIEKEIENTKIFEQQVRENDIKIQKIHKELEIKKRDEERLSKIAESKLKVTIKEVGDLAGEVSQLIKTKKERDEIKKKQKKEKLISESKQFKRDMKDLINLKEELKRELSEAKKDEEKRKKELEIAKDKEKADEIKKMLKDISKKKST